HDLEVVLARLEAVVAADDEVELGHLEDLAAAVGEADVHALVDALLVLEGHLHEQGLLGGLVGEGALVEHRRGELEEDREVGELWRGGGCGGGGGMPPRAMLIVSSRRPPAGVTPRPPGVPGPAAGAGWGKGDRSTGRIAARGSRGGDAGGGGGKEGRWGGRAV